MPIEALFRNANQSSIPELKTGLGWKQIPIAESNESLVPLGPFLSRDKKEGFISGQADVGFSDRIFADAIYLGERPGSSPYKLGSLDGSLLTPFVREGVAKKLVKAAAFLPRGHAFLIWDSYRPLAVQKALYDDYYQQLIDEKGMTSEQATVEAQKLVSIPSQDPTKPSPHNTGASIDLTIVKFDPTVLPELNRLNRMLRSNDWQQQYSADMGRMKLMREHSTLLNMGTEFDSAAPQTTTRYYEKKLEVGTLTREDQEILNNRRLLCNVMARAGFSNYPDEWWHFDSGNQFDAFRTARPAIYGTAEFTSQCQAWEAMRVGHYSGNISIWNNSLEPKSVDTALVDFVKKVTLKTGNPRSTGHGQAQRLQAQ